MQKLKENFPIIIGLSIPVLMVLIIGAVIYGEQTFSSVPAPSQNFVYALGENVVGASPYGYAPIALPPNSCANEYYRVASGTLKKYSAEQKDKNNEYCKDLASEQKQPMFFLHDVVTNVSTKLSFEEVALLKLDTAPKSKDGYEYTQYQNRGDMGLFSIFGGNRNDYNARYLKNDAHYEKMNLQIPTETYYGPDVFLGWVTK